MVRQKRKVKGITIGKVFLMLWVSAFISFIFTIDTNNTGSVFSPFLTKLFIFNICFGIFAFIMIFVGKVFSKSSLSAKFANRISIIVIAYFLFYVLSITSGGHGLIAAQFRSQPKINSELSDKVEGLKIIPLTNTPSPTIANKQQNYIAPTNDPDPIISCTSSYPNCVGQPGLQLRKSQCSNIICCQIGNSWSIYVDKNSCTQAQNSYWSNYYKSRGNNNTSNSNYVSIPCATKHGTYTAYGKDYTEAYKECSELQNLSDTSSYMAPSSVIIDCTVEGEVIGKMSSEECLRKINEYYSLKKQLLDIQQTARDNQAQKQSCIDKANSDYRNFMAILGAQGAANSSVAEQAEVTRQKTIDNCVKMYPILN